MESGMVASLVVSFVAIGVNVAAAMVLLIETYRIRKRYQKIQDWLGVIDYLNQREFVFGINDELSLTVITGRLGNNHWTVTTYLQPKHGSTSLLDERRKLQTYYFWGNVAPAEFVKQIEADPAAFYVKELL